MGERERGTIIGTMSIVAWESWNPTTKDCDYIRALECSS